MKIFPLLFACGVTLFAAGNATAAPAADEKAVQEIRRILSEHPDIILDVLREHSEDVLDIAQLGADTKRSNALHTQWEADELVPKHPALEGRPFRGPATAPVTLVAFSDFTCGYCQQAAFTVDALLKRYPDEIRFVFKQSPGSETGILASRWFVAASRLDMDKAWDFYSRLFDAQQSLLKDPLPTLRKLAEKAGYDVKTLEELLQKKGKEIDKLVASDLQERKDFGFRGTPYFLVNNLILRGAMPLETFIDAVEFTRKRK